ncbi:MAG TPA: NAD-dependent epimerase/dehydratase family protein [Thermoplasmata archaeon]|nr:NAD-dependent epimerase/dehydratase family protein [Thermoplasmata archaeon]HUJ78302.1 NAD-dependent epimerase/dehydratase family protein [Thermoplasmata archaeon]
MSAGSSRPTAVVTGGAGAIGSVLVESLLRDGYAVRVVDNLSSGRRDHLPGARAGAPVELTVADLREPIPLDVVRGAEAVWHLAANPDIRLGTAEPRTDLEHGTIATFHALEAARRADAKRFLFSSSSVVYGLPTVFPTPETYGPLLPESLYGASKLASEGLVSAYAHTYGLRGYVFRFANIIGSRMTHGVIYDFIEKLRRNPTRLEVLGDGRQAKSYLWVDDCVGGMRAAEAGARDPVNVFNLGSVDRISVSEIAGRVVRAMGGRATVEYAGGPRGWPGDVPQQFLAIDRIRALGWSPRLSSAEAVDRAIASLLPAAGPAA